MQITPTNLIQVAALAAAVGSVSAAPVPSAQLLTSSHSEMDLVLARRDIGQDVQNFFNNIFHPEKTKAEREKKEKAEADKKKAEEDKKKTDAPAADADAMDRRDIGDFFRNIFHPDPAKVEKEKKEKEENDRKIKELKEKMEKEDKEKKAKAVGATPPAATAPAVVDNTSKPPSVLITATTPTKSSSDKTIPAEYHDAIAPYLQGGKYATGHRKVVCFADMQAHTWTLNNGKVLDGHVKGPAHLTHGKDKPNTSHKHATAAAPTTSTSSLSFLFGGHSSTSGKAVKNPHDEMDHPAVCISYDATTAKNGNGTVTAPSNNKTSTGAQQKQKQVPLLTKVQQAQIEAHAEDTGRGKAAAEQKQASAGNAFTQPKSLDQMSQNELREKLRQLLLASGSGNSKKQTLATRNVDSDGLAAGKTNAEWWDQYNAHMSGEPTALEESYLLADQAAKQHPPIQTSEVSDSAPSSLDAALRKAGAIKRSEIESRSLLSGPSFDFAPRSVNLSRER